MKKKIAKFINSRGGKGVVIGTSIFFLVGILAFVLGYGLTNGWDYVLKWFTSKWAMIVYVFILLWIVVIINLIYISKTIGDDN